MRLGKLRAGFHTLLFTLAVCQFRIDKLKDSVSDVYHKCANGLANLWPSQPNSTVVLHGICEVIQNRMQRFIKSGHFGAWNTQFWHVSLHNVTC